MVTFLRAYDFKTIRRKLVALYFLNVSDALLTYLLVGTGRFREINFLLERAAGDMGALFLIKILLPAALIAWLYMRIELATERQLRPSNAAVNSVFLLYVFVNLLHLVWTASFLGIKPLSI